MAKMIRLLGLSDALGRAIIIHQATTLQLKE
jgi:hypothetical protein